MPCEGCPGAEVWSQMSDALQSPDPVLQAAGELARQLLGMSEPSQPIVVETPAMGQLTPICCNQALRLVEATLKRTEHAIQKNDEAIALRESAGAAG